MAAMATDALRFTDFPPEIRDRIYEFILCSWPRPRSTYDERRQFAIVPTDMAYIHHRVEIGILLANHWISRDAMSVLFKKNLFIRIVFRGVDAPSILRPKQVPIVAEGALVVDAFRGYVMSHLIEVSGTDILPSCHIMILGRDFDLFCQALAGWGNAHFGAYSTHCVTVHDPFANTSTPNYLTLKKQERLLQPYRQHLRGFTSFRIVGNVEPSLAEIVTHEVNQDFIQDPQDLVEEMMREKALGKEYYDQGKSKMASETWSRATIKLFQMAGSNIWTRMEAQAPDGWSYTIAEIFFQLNSNLAANTLRVMRKEEVEDPDLAGQRAVSLYNALEMASSASDIFNPNWRPTPDQKGKLCYRLATAHRIAKDRVDIAESCIDFAAQQFPNDWAVQQEKRKIAEWRAREA